jgi:hypothetical protein
MPYRSPYLRLDELRQDRFDKHEQTARDTAKTFPAAALSLRDMLNEEDARKREIEQQIFKNDLSTKENARADEQLGVSKSYRDIQKRSTEEAAAARKVDQEMRAREAMRQKVKDLAEGSAAVMNYDGSDQPQAAETAVPPEDSLRDKVKTAAPMIGFMEKSPVFSGGKGTPAPQPTQPISGATESPQTSSRNMALWQAASEEAKSLIAENPDLAPETDWRLIASAFYKNAQAREAASRRAELDEARINRLNRPSGSPYQRPLNDGQMNKLTEAEIRMEEIDEITKTLDAGAMSGPAAAINAGINKALRWDRATENQKEFEVRRNAFFSEELKRLSGATVVTDEARRAEDRLGRLSDPVERTRVFMKIARDLAAKQYKIVYKNNQQVGRRMPENVLEQSKPETEVESREAAIYKKYGLE